ncbi:uncharacterized protein LOC110018554 [Phalaenopsis equestris]|uniref:uncharacterized protein LOC110018554 n=1 Tax=Phalaenopsis equestris TaxID=78828 RepID=UPI0009E64C0C|nr:uncharacterized protein LOC110018554 [Phalaenopsis equestris]
MGFEFPYELRCWWEYTIIFFLRPLLAILFIFSLILLSWFVAWKTVLVHVPLVQEIFGLRKKPVRPKPPNRHRFSRFYNSNSSIRSVVLLGLLCVNFDAVVLLFHSIMPVTSWSGT